MIVCHASPCTWPLSTPCLKFGLHTITTSVLTNGNDHTSFDSLSVQAYLVYIRTAQCWKPLEVMSGRHCPCSASMARHCRLGSRCPADMQHTAGRGWWCQGWNQSQVGSLYTCMKLASKVVNATHASIDCYCSQDPPRPSVWEQTWL